MREREYALTIKDLGEDDYLKFNHNLSGFYLCNYLWSKDPLITETGQKEIRGLLKNVTKLNAIDRYGLISDMLYTGGL